MSLDYRKATYRPSRPDTRNVTSYGSMSKWIQRRGEIVQPKGRVPKNLLDLDNPTPKFTKKRPIIKPSPAGMPSMYDTYLNNSSAVLDESVPVHLRYSKHCGYDDFHKAFRSMGDKFPQLTFPHYGPPRLRHGRQGGSWRHVKEVLQAGGNRIVFVDGQVASNDMMKIDQVPGGHLILPSVESPGRGTPSPRLIQQLSRMDSNTFYIGKDRPTQPVPVARYDALDADKGVQKNNWNIMR